MHDPADADRFPLLTDAGRRRLARLREHPSAPHWRHRCGERLTAAGLASVRAYAEEVGSKRPSWRSGEVAAWVPEFIERCREEVPFYRDRLPAGADFFALPTTCRDDLRRNYWAFVPDPADLSELVTYWTSGTAGDRVLLPTHPEAPARYLPLFEAALAARGVRIDGGDRTSIVQAVCQRRTYTFPSVMSYFGGAGYAKLNLHADEWRDPADRAAYLDDFPPEVVTGDPVGLTELARLRLRAAPKAVLSSATALLPGTRRHLEAHFGCPVLNVYGMIEVGPIACGDSDGLEVLPPNLFVEILDTAGEPCPPVTRGEVVVTGGINPFVPLVRYRTGDFAALDFAGPVPKLVGFEGRPPVLFRTAAGVAFNSIDVSGTLADLPLPFLAVRQRADGSVVLRTRTDPATVADAAARLHELFAGAAVEVDLLPDGVPWDGKTIQYRTALPTGHE